MKKMQSKVILILTFILILTGCSNLITELSRIELSGETKVKLATSDEQIKTATMIMTDEDKGLDIDSDGIVDAALVESASDPSSGIYALDFDNDGIVDFYLFVSAAGTSTLNTNKDGSGTAGTVTVSDDGTITGIDTDGDGNPNVTTSTSNTTTAAATEHSITYNSNGSDAGTAPSDSTVYSTGESITILGNPDSLAEGTNLFVCWNTASDKSGTDYIEGDSLVVSDNNIVLYAIYRTLPQYGDGLLIKGIAYRAISTTNTMETIGDDETLSGEVTPLTHLLGHNLVKIGFGTFQNSTSITTINIPEGVTEIRGMSFYGCTGLTEIILPSTLAIMSENFVFKNCTTLTSITLPSSVKTLGQNVFEGCTNLTSISMPGMESLGVYAFKNTGFINLDLPEGLNSIDDSTFSNCSRLVTLTLPASITSIPPKLLEDCTSVTTITLLGNNVSINDTSFHNCTALTDLYIYGSIPTTSKYLMDESVTVHVPLADIEYYKNNLPWSEWSPEPF